MIRGLWTHNTVLYSVKDDKLYSVDSAGLTTERGTLFSISGPVDFESTLSQLCINDGSYLYVYDPIGATLTTSTGYPGGDRISFIDQRINALQRGTQKFYWSDLANAGNFNALSFSSAESSPDRLVSQIAFNGELVLFGETSIEIWDPSGNADSVYSKSSAAIDFGCLAPHTVQKTANAVYWLARDVSGQATVRSLQGHQSRRVSTRAQEEKFAGLTLANSRAYTYSDGGQSFYCINVPGVDTTLVYDETFNQWHERGEWDGRWSQWRPTCHAFAYGKHHFGAGDDIYVLDRDVHKFGDDAKRRMRISPVISKPTMNRVFFSSFEVLCEKGTGAQIALRWSDDNGFNWSNWHYSSVGQIGQFARRAMFNRLGAGYDRVFELSMSDDAPFNPVSVDVRMR